MTSKGWSLVSDPWGTCVIPWRSTNFSLIALHSTWRSECYFFTVLGFYRIAIFSGPSLSAYWLYFCLKDGESFRASRRSQRFGIGFRLSGRLVFSQQPSNLIHLQGPRSVLLQSSLHPFWEILERNMEELKSRDHRIEECGISWAVPRDKSVAATYLSRGLKVCRRRSDALGSETGPCRPKPSVRNTK